MKKRLLRIVIMTSYYSLLIIAIQALSLNLLIAHPNHGQSIERVSDVYLSLDIENVKLKEVFKVLEERTNFRFSYDKNHFDNDLRISISGEAKSLEEVLLQISKEATLHFRQINNSIEVRRILTLSEQEEPVEIVIEQVNVQGRITDESGQPLPGASIIVKGTTDGTTTDVEGNYRINCSDNAVLSISFVGYETQDISVNGRSVINFQMSLDDSQLDEVVVIGYGTSKMSDLTGSVSKLNHDDIEVGSQTNVEQQLNGRFSGVNVVSSGGQPGAGTSIRIRGTSSILGNTQPLFVIDGIPQGSNISANINPNDIESIQVLKDASATAIYGSRGANGVIIITTKGSKRGKPVISVNSYVGQNSISKKVDLLDAVGLAQVHQMAIDQGYGQLYDPSTITEPGTDWQDEMFRKAFVQNYQVSVAGSNDNVQYRFSGNYSNQEGIVIGSDFERYSFRANIVSNITDKLEIGGNIYSAKTKSNNSGGARSAIMRANPIYPVKDDQGEYTLYVDPTNRIGNPVATALLETHENNEYSTQINLFAGYDILNDLRFETRLGTIATQDKTNNFAPLQTAGGFNSNISSGVNTSSYYYWVSNNTLTYDKSLANNSNLNIMAGFIAESNRTESVNASSSDYITGKQEYHSLESGLVQSASSQLTESQLASFIGRINYIHNDKYLVTVNARYDGSSKFGSKNKWAFFPSGALAWRISNEDFMKEINFISNLKLRTSYGVTGEQGIAPYQTLPGMNNVGALFAGSTLVMGFYPSSLGNANLKWESTAQANIGIDAGFLNDRISFTFDAYKKTTTDLLYRVALPSTTGYTNYFANVGSIENKGIEFSLNTVNTRGPVQWNTNFNISANRNKVLDLGNRADGSNIDRIEAPSGGVGAPEGGSTPNPSGLIEGEAIGGIYGWVYEGTYKTATEISNGPEPNKVPGDARYKDLNEDGMIDANDRQVISKAYPDFYGGLTNTFSFKGFDLSVFLQFKVGHELFSSNHFRWSEFTGVYNNQPWALDAWSESNTESDIPRATWNYRANGISTFHVFDASFLRAKNITLGYQLPLRKIAPNIQSFRLYVSVDNAFTITDYLGFDPDASSTGGNAIASSIDDTIYPLPKSYILGLNIKF